MDENNKKDIIEEELESVTPGDASLTEEDLANNIESVEEAADNIEAEASEAIKTAEETSDAIESVEAAAESGEAIQEATESDEQPQKKKGVFQKPVIIALCLVVVALLGYLAYNAFFLREPEGVTWSTEIDGITYYIDFNNDNTFNAYVGSIEIDGTYSKDKNQPKQDLTGSGATFDESETVDTLTVNYQIAYFYPGYPAEYKITGSRILGNQVLHGSYGEGYDFTLEQAKRQKPDLQVPEDFQADKDLVGSWIFTYEGQEIYKMTINEDGTMNIKKFQEGTTYNGTYTVSDGQINFTYFVTESTAVPLDYSLNGDILTCMGVNFAREGSGATPDQPFAEMEEEAAQETAAATEAQ